MAKEKIIIDDDMKEAFQYLKTKNLLTRKEIRYLINIGKRSRTKEITLIIGEHNNCRNNQNHTTKGIKITCLEDLANKIKELD